MTDNIEQKPFHIDQFSKEQEDSHRVFRKWITEHCRAQNEPAYVAYYQAMCATFHRTIRYGIEKNLEHLGSRDILQFQIVCAPSQIESLLGIAFSRAIAQQDTELIDIILQQPFIQEFHSWYKELIHADESLIQNLLMRPASLEESCCAKLVLGRRFPHCIQASWFTDFTLIPRILAHALCRLIATTRSDLHPNLMAFLQTNHGILLVDDPDLILAPLVASAKQTPQSILMSWQGYFGDRTLCAAAEWHLEHSDPEACLHVLRQVRFLSLEHNRAQTLRCLALIAKGMFAEASTHLADIDEQQFTRIVLIRLATAARNLVNDNKLAETIASCGPENAQTIIVGFQELLQRKRLDLAKQTCEALRAQIRAGLKFDSAVEKILDAILPKTPFDRDRHN